MTQVVGPAVASVLNDRFAGRRGPGRGRSAGRGEADRRPAPHRAGGRARRERPAPRAGAAGGNAARPAGRAGGPRSITQEPGGQTSLYSPSTVSSPAGPSPAPSP